MRVEVYLSPVEKRRVAHALRQNADATRRAAAAEPPEELADVVAVRKYKEQLLEVAHEHERLATDIERSDVRLERLGSWPTT